ncbi:LPS export ABC transporter periplasmic protein LptC [Alphaproteobacteria bacterium GH1-50]|uniref:LPS export ABC transporter periplasmic protein LptC n=1 Tax=Kangsaoukella pontilimi TaxID=2691042 RepID=A0A7C9MK89_9RHOB|nr:LPS export ABC transporter periplasmic protein LptC [Kangsaoukella pontilimi]MXQ08315.1 LPS export ABC transporter periplasmic protein LptC [Kangsaoukella pontilimi]
MSRDDRYSRLVLWLKVAFPLAALAILSTLFMVAETLDPEAAIPYAEVDVEQIMREQGVTRPTFGGVTQDGVQIALGAEAVRPSGAAYRGTELNVTLDLPQGGRITVVSPEGTIDVPGEAATLDGGVEVESTTGYRVETQTLRTAWSVATLETDSTVTATGPGGDIEAGRMVLSADGEGGGHVLVFKDGVRLVYRPGF